MMDILRQPWASGLPVAHCLPSLERALGESTKAVLIAPPGAGKTTLTPLALLGAAWLGGRRILMLEPRRLATRAAAQRMASLLGESAPGGVVGYRLRGESRAGPGTRVEVVTEGVLTRMLQADPTLPGVGLVIFDEFHERSLHGDVGLALTLHAHSLLRPDLRVLVMSATLDGAGVGALLGDAPVVEAEGRLHAVETRWRQQPVSERVEAAATSAILKALGEEDGDILMFLPGAGEIRRVADGLSRAGLGAEVAVRPLYGDLGREDQEAAIAPSPYGQRKIVLATSIAETSLTIEGVRVVIDSGLMRLPRFDPRTGLTRLVTVRVTRDAADQRCGRAGRQGPGVCYRLWTRAEDRGLVPRRRPEILEADLSTLALDLALWGASPDELPWLDAPPPAAVAQAGELLRELDLVDDAGRVTDHGRRVADLGLHPRLGHMLIQGTDLGLQRLAIDMAAILGERDFLHAEDRLADADLGLRVETLLAAGRAPSGVSVSVDRAALGRVRREADRLRRLLDRTAEELGRRDKGRDDRGRTGRDHRGRRGGRRAGGDDEGPGKDRPTQGVGLLTALAYPDRVGQRRGAFRGRFLLRNGRGARFAEPQSLDMADWIVAAELEDRGAEARIFRAAAVSQAEIEAHFAGQVRELDEVFWDVAEERVVARRRRALGALTFAQHPLERPDATAVGMALVDGIRGAGLHVLPWTAETRQLRERLEFLHRLDPERWPTATEDSLAASVEDWLLPFLPGLRRLTDLRRIDLAQALLARVPWEQRGRLDELAPPRLEVPSGSSLRIDYSDPEAPALAVRLQEVFGMLRTPNVGGDRVPLTVILLSPAGRPVQVTRDLASFWRDAYFEVRKDLRGRYPKHQWPDDPLRAEPTRRTRRGAGPG